MAGPRIVRADVVDRPTSLNFVGADAHVVTLTGNVLRFQNVAKPGERCRFDCR